DSSKAAIAGKRAAEVYGLRILCSDISESEDNFTRFIIVGNQKIFRKDANKVSICFEVPHLTGSLYQMLSHIIYNDLNMTKIESRPIPDRPWEYRFFLDFEGNLADPSVRNALQGHREESRSLRILGNY
ncbi:MAG: prephenate dehydratase, partial [Bacteroidaceae bacterium]|nr:prephenate dehydratase [Bacteroidaceae bacterium]